MKKTINTNLFLFGIMIMTGCYAVKSGSRQPIHIPAGLPAATPWDLALLSKPPVFKWIDCNDTVWSLTYQGQPYKDKAVTSVFAYYATPGTLAGNRTLDKKIPGIVLVHGGGGTAYREWVELWARRGYAAIAMDLYGCMPDHKKLDDGVEGISVFSDIEPVTNQWPYHAVSNVISAHSLLRSFSEVDADRTAITGISWGGFFTCIAAGLDDRFKVAVPVYGCGFLHENSAWTGQLAEMTPEGRARWIQSFDPSRYVGLAKMPMLFVTGTNDNSYPLDSYVKTYNLVKTCPNLRIMINMPHGHSPGWAPSEIQIFIDQYLKGGLPLPVIGPEISLNGQIQAEVVAKTKLLSAEINYTTETDKIDQCKWQTKPAEFDGKEIKAALPANTTIWFFTVRDEREAIVSGRVHFLR